MIVEIGLILVVKLTIVQLVLIVIMEKRPVSILSMELLIVSFAKLKHLVIMLVNMPKILQLVQLVALESISMCFYRGHSYWEPDLEG